MSTSKDKVCNLSLFEGLVREFASAYAKVALVDVPPVPESVIEIVAKTPYGLKNPYWHEDTDEIPQAVTALVLIQESPAGKAWGVNMADVSQGAQPSDKRFRMGCTGLLRVETQTCVEWFFKRSGLTEMAPFVNMEWPNKNLMTGFNPQAKVGIRFSCNAILIMLHACAAQMFENHADLAVMQSTISELQNEISTLKTQLSRSEKPPAITCLMHLFAGHYPYPICGTCTSELTAPTFNIAPHTDRLSDLGLDAQKWLLEQLSTRNLWVRATSIDSYDNHISWSQFEGAVEMGMGVVFSHGNYRFC